MLQPLMEGVVVNQPRHSGQPRQPRRRPSGSSAAANMTFFFDSDCDDSDNESERDLKSPTDSVESVSGRRMLLPDFPGVNFHRGA